MTTAPADRVRALLSYDPDTGVFRWRANRTGTARAGLVAGAVRPDGARQIQIDGRLYLAHRLAWLVAYGAWPADEIDHIDGDRANNRLHNLREATRSLNMQNLKRATATNKLRLLGVSPHRRRFQACIHLAGKKRHLGLYDTPEAAHTAYLDAKRRLHAGCTI